MAVSSKPQSVPDLDWYRDIVEGGPETIVIIDHDGIILFHSSHGAIDPSFFVGKAIYEFFLPEFHAIVRKTVAKVFETGQQDMYELASNYGREDALWYTTRLAPIIREGQVAAVTLFIRETTQQKQAQQVLNRINLDLENIVDERTEALNNYTHRLEATERLNIALRKAENWQGVFKTLAEHALEALETDLAGVYLLHQGRLDYSYSLGHTAEPPDSLSPEKDPFLYRMLRPNAIRFVPLVDEVDSDCNFCCYIRSQDMKTLMIAPLHTGEVIAGVLYLGSRRQRTRNPQDERLLSSFVESASNTLHRILVMRQLEQNVQQREHELRVLYDVMSIASETMDQATLLRKALAATLEAVHCEMGVIHLTDSAARKLKAAACQQVPKELLNYLLLSGTAINLWDKAFSEREVVQARGVITQSYHEQTGPGVQEWDYLGIPIRVRDTVLGVLSLFGNEELLEPGNLQLVSTIADQIGLAYENTIKRQRENETLIFAERQRLARDLHDSVSQSLYGLVLSADVSNKLLKVKAYSKLAETLQEIGDVALQSLKEMRLMLFELRPVSFESVGLVGALELRLNTVEERANIHTALTIKGREYLSRGYDLEVYRIATEALNNSLKHSRASEIKVELVASPRLLELTICDNGVGFDASGQPAGGMGLASMQERASRIGGKLTVESSVQHGTRIHLHLPTRLTQKRQPEAAV